MRSSINKHRTRNFFIGLICSLSLVLFAFNVKVHRTANVIIEELEATAPPMKVFSIVFPPEPPKEKPAAPRRQKTEPFRPDGNIKVVSDLVALRPTKPIAKPQPLNLPLLPMPSPVGDASSKVENWVDVPPSFPGGSQALMKFMHSNIIYPPDCYDMGEEGLVRVKYVVDEEGNITDIIVLNNELFESAEKEVLRVLKLMPKWQPAIKNGKAVKSYFIQPVHFTLN